MLWNNLGFLMAVLCLFLGHMVSLLFSAQVTFWIRATSSWWVMSAAFCLASLWLWDGLCFGGQGQASFHLAVRAFSVGTHYHVDLHFSDILIVAVSKDVELLWLCCFTVGHIVKGCSWLQFGCDAASSEKSWPVWNWLFRKSVQTDCNCIEDQMQPVSCGSVRSATIQPKCQNQFLRWTPMKAEESGGAYASLGTRQEGGSFEDVGLSVYASPLRILVLGFQRTEFWWSAVGPKVSGGIRETEETEEFVGSIQCNIQTEELPPQHTEVIYYNSRYVK